MFDFNSILFRIYDKDCCKNYPGVSDLVQETWNFCKDQETIKNPTSIEIGHVEETCKLFLGGLGKKMLQPDDVIGKHMLIVNYKEALNIVQER